MSATRGSIGVAGLVALWLILLSGLPGRTQTVDFTFLGQGFE